jgi:hypothetical protein
MCVEPCQHPTRVKSIVELEFRRPDNSERSAYSGAVSMGICEDCGHVELYALFQDELCAWLKKG